MSVLTVLGLAVAAVNVGLTLYHWRLVRRAERHLAACRRREVESERLLESIRQHAGALTEATAGRNGHGPPELRP